MKKSKFIKSTIILIIGGLITKILGMIVKVCLTNSLSIEGYGLYSLILPTFLLLINISGFGLTTALNVLISTDKYNNKNLIITTIYISFIIEFILFFILLLLSSSIATNLLHNNILKFPILFMSITLPFISVSNIFRSYYFAKERLIPHVITNIIEDVIKLLLIIIILPKINNIEHGLKFIVLTNILCELSSIIIFFILFPKFKIYKEDLKIDFKNIKAIFKISIPTTLSRLIGSITYFLEPIILTFILIKVGYTETYIVREYGIINAYVLPIILLPSFFTNAISQALIPSISKNYINKNYKEVKRKLNQAMTISLILGIIFTIGFMIFSPTLLKFLYNTNEGIKYIYFLAPIFIFHYLEHPLLATLQAINKAKINMNISLINMLIRTIGLAILSSLKIGMYGLLISLILNIVFTTIYARYKIKKLLIN